MEQVEEVEQALGAIPRIVSRLRLSVGREILGRVFQDWDLGCKNLFLKIGGVKDTQLTALLFKVEGLKARINSGLRA